MEESNQDGAIRNAAIKGKLARGVERVIEGKRFIELSAIEGHATAIELHT